MQLNESLLENDQTQINLNQNVLKIGTLNCKNFKANYVYINELLEKNDILFLQETWLKTNKEAKLLINPDFKFVHKSSIKSGNTRGRPYGGTAWILKKKINDKVKVTYFDDCISSCKIGDELWLIGVYLKFNNGTVEAILEHEEQIGKLLDIIENIYQQNSTAKIAILGDFNSDLYRRTNFDDLMKHLIEFEQLTSIDTLYFQKTDHTFFNKNNKSKIDHILVNEKLTKNCKQANILNDIKHKPNTSDHLAIEFEIDFNLKLKSDCNNNYSKKKPKWNELDFRLEYEKRLCEKLNQLDTAKLARINKHNSKIILTELINELTSSMRCSINDIQQAEKNNQNNKHTKRKRWWDNEIQKMSDDVKNAYKQLDNIKPGDNINQLEAQLNELKKSYRRKQRQKKASISTKWTKQINTLYYTHKD
ncbi:RNA-directed DNA polymerase from mobile element jockey-like, partial [Brachionus plicatilis]